MNNAIHSIRVLIVDDMIQVRQGLTAVLSLAGEAAGIPVQVVGEAGDGQEAIQQARLLQPEVVLMDLVMPGTDGFTATRAIKAENPQIRVLALSVYGDPEYRLKASLAGMDGFIEKGTRLLEILEALQAGHAK